MVALEVEFGDHLINLTLYLLYKKIIIAIKVEGK